ncbi:MAG: ubiquinone biosynthesis protein UbiE [Ignavibacteria bacterium GWF2_33_9]|nr:MAG: ubiquinone biosynthesis protein UbiE [Ignavibacteria bacterium GWF2_33_9]
MSEEVRNMFASISGNYDKMNSILSFGIHHRWRKVTVNEANLQSGQRVLDCATGTGDLAFAFWERLNKITDTLPNQVIGTDFCEDMMIYAHEKNEKIGNAVKFEFADVMSLQYESDTFDISSISFGIRNVDDPKRGVSELARVVKPGGKVLILEFGQPNGLFAVPYKIYSKYIMPQLGKLFASDKSAYTYLPVTASKFPAAENFLDIMNSTGQFSKTYYRKLTFGVAYLYVGIVK